MRLEQVKSVINSNKKGTFITASWKHDCKLKKAYKNDNNVSKISVATVRLGVTYDNINNVKEKRENGTLPEENQGLPWGTWVMFPYIIEHKGNYYLRLSLANNNPIKTRYWNNGNETTYNNIENMLLASEKPKNKEIDVITVQIENLLYL